MKTRFLLLSLVGSVLPAATVDIQSEDGTVTITRDGELFTEYRTDARVPYLYPIRSSSGAVVTRHWPMSDDYEKENRDHPHHRSLWLSHGDVNGFDFWSWRGDGDPRIVHQGTSETKTTDQSASFTVNLTWEAAGKTHLEEERRHTITWPDEKTSVIEVVSKLTAAGDGVRFGDTKEGTFGLRVDRTLRLKGEVAEGHIADSEGREDGEVWGKRSHWVAFTGPDEKDEPAVVAMMDHPSNLRHPTWWHARDYGLLAANPFGIHDFEGKDDETLGDYTLEKDESLTLRYQVIIHHGTLESAALPEHFEKFSQ